MKIIISYQPLELFVVSYAFHEEFLLSLAEYLGLEFGDVDECGLEVLFLGREYVELIHELIHRCRSRFTPDEQVLRIGRCLLVLVVQIVVHDRHHHLRL